MNEDNSRKYEGKKEIRGQCEIKRSIWSVH